MRFFISLNLIGDHCTRSAEHRYRKKGISLPRKLSGLSPSAVSPTAQLKEQAAQIQKVSAQIEANKPAPQVVANKP